MKQPKNSRNGAIDARLTGLCEGLFYISETDAEVIPFKAKGLQSIEPKELGQYFELTKTEMSEIGRVEDFFCRVSLVKEWFSKDQRDAARQFKKIEAIFTKELTETRMIRFGRIRIEIFLLGIDPEGNVIGIRTKAVET